MQQVKFPNKCKIGQFNYSISVVDNLEDNNGALFGDVIYKNQEIRLDSGMSKERTRSVLLHEIIHALMEGSCPVEEEFFVRSFGMTLFNFMCENRNLIKFIMGDE